MLDCGLYRGRGLLAVRGKAEAIAHVAVWLGRDIQTSRRGRACEVGQCLARVLRRVAPLGLVRKKKRRAHLSRRRAAPVERKYKETLQNQTRAVPLHYRHQAYTALGQMVV